MCNEIIPRDFFLLKLMKNDNLDEGMMEEAGCLLRRRSFLNSGGHFFNTSMEEEREIEQFGSCEMHEKSDMVSIDSGESSLTSEVFHDYLHEGGITSQQI